MSESRFTLGPAAKSVRLEPWAQRVRLGLKDQSGHKAQLDLLGRKDLEARLAQLRLTSGFALGAASMTTIKPGREMFAYWVVTSCQSFRANQLSTDGTSCRAALLIRFLARLMPQCAYTLGGMAMDQPRSDLAIATVSTTVGSSHAASRA